MKTNEFNPFFPHTVDLIFTIPIDQLEDWQKTLKRLKTLQKEGEITVKYTIKDKGSQDFSSEI
jgi:coproporphyrinogen III oxidase-like Fe-S oxidoreductase